MNKFGADPLFILKSLVLCTIGVLILQTFDIQVLNRNVYQVKSKSMVTHTKNLYAERGSIMDRNGVVFAESIRDTSDNLGYSRLFLQGSLASQIVGKVGFDGIGNMGMEKIYNDNLRGDEGIRLSIQDVKKHEVYSRSKNVVEARSGLNLVLTIDRNMQEIVEKALKDGVAEFNAKSASAVVVDPVTGEILAMASYPTFDPNSKNQGVDRAAKNEIVSLSYEPGSTFKVITAAAALENNVVSPLKVFANEGKCWQWNPRSEKICDTHIYGDMDMSEAMVQSSNIVFAKIASEVGAVRMHKMARAFGIGERAFDNYAGEESGRLLTPAELTRDDRTLKTMGFGHAVSVTPIQMVMAYAAVANGGKLMRPQIVKEWRNSSGDVVKKVEPMELRRVISEKTAASIRKMLNRVVNSGTAKRVASQKLPDVLFGGKTGTAEKYNHITRSYDRNSQVASFIGLAPSEDTRYVCLVLVDDPQGKHVGGLTAGPIFRRIMEGIYFHPSLSPLAHNLKQVKLGSPCDKDFAGMPVTAAKDYAKKHKCPVRFEGKGLRVISERVDAGLVNGKTLLLGDAVASRMPNLQGLSLRDALEVMGNIRMNVEYTGKGRVVAQEPKAEEALQKGMTCKLTLKEKS
ncbi:peptidoglycan glycosyltransferase [Fibrobacter sp. UWB2]|uniref:Cell division protein FtsI (Penicillin-binding protein 3) n=1 Tax=Fibrobacter succinogenes TaxID=833 RepID=A0A380RYF4_FIBSU|nr:MULTISPECIES: penicillin-binding protein [Fibrobacter]OWV23609.1 peptidoglycan glycosyltransferase [Fibrobacter sp. UWB2]PWJ37750.1 cell division protein FtsI (penicillin-binding protein 3)/stage V sporulation protein D (sporulation-specific penicillin-binding protein) [Fibrobacter succinogenes subsp. elongatus]SUQ19997.1 cell division protein FtsI (penicillin-binding protein 3) [Fibrobacter succinogenes]